MIWFILVATLLIALLAYVALQPDTFRIERSTTIAAPPAAVFERVNDLRKWQDWSPWAKMDPNAKSTFAGPVAGEGASFRWEGNRNVGVGTMTIVESVPPRLVRFRLDFETPMKGTNEAIFTLRPEGAGTRVSWAMTGRSNFMHRLVCVVMNPDKMVGGQFEKGLATLKALAEGKA